MKKPLLGGVDVSAKELAVAIDSGTGRVWEGTFPNDPTGHHQLVRRLSRGPAAARGASKPPGSTPSICIWRSTRRRASRSGSPTQGPRRTSRGLGCAARRRIGPMPSRCWSPAGEWTSRAGRRRNRRSWLCGPSRAESRPIGGRARRAQVRLRPRKQVVVRAVRSRHDSERPRPIHCVSSVVDTDLLVGSLGPAPGRSS